MVLVARSVDKLEAVRKEIVASGGSALVVPCDITGGWIVLIHSSEKILFRRACGDKVAGAGGGPLPWRGGLCGQQRRLCAPPAQVEPGH